MSENTKDELLERFVQNQETYHDFMIKAARRWEMIVYPAIFGVFILTGIFVAVLFTMLSNFQKDLHALNKGNVATAEKTAIYAPVKEQRKPLVNCKNCKKVIEL